LPLPSAEQLKVADANVERLGRLTALSNVPAVELERARAEAARLRAAVKTEEVERERSLGELREAVRKLEEQMSSSELRAPMDGILSEIKTIDGELVK
jgi:multidrug resistance efflux pump